jgi:hypothetical protein
MKIISMNPRTLSYSDALNIMKESRKRRMVIDEIGKMEARGGGVDGGASERVLEFEDRMIAWLTTYLGAAPPTDEQHVAFLTELCDPALGVREHLTRQALLDLVAQLHLPMDIDAPQMAGIVGEAVPSTILEVIAEIAEKHYGKEEEGEGEGEEEGEEEQGAPMQE